MHVSSLNHGTSRRRSNVRTVAMLVCLAASPALARADDLLITAGHLDIQSLSAAALRLQGDRGFTFAGSTLTGISSAWETCLSGACAPGDRMSLLGSWSGSDVVGTATLDGTTYTKIGSIDNTTASLRVVFSGSFVLPPQNGYATVVAPFVFTGEFAHTGAVETLVGNGVTTISLSWVTGFPARWRITQILYAFGDRLPSSWMSRDIGPVGVQGRASFLRDTFAIAGNGGDIWGTSDAFRFAYQPMPGSGSVTARVVAANRAAAAGSVFAKAGVMIRQGLPPASAHVILDVKPDGALEFMVRYEEDQPTTFLAGAQTTGDAVWLRLTRHSAHITGSYSNDGSNWTELGSVTVPFVTTELAAGLAVTSHQTNALYAALFDNVSVTGQQLTENLLAEGDFEGYTPPALGQPGWISDDLLRQVPAKSETHQPHAGTKNGACWTPEYVDCGIYQEVIAPTSGLYAFSIYATADRPGGLTGVNVNGVAANSATVEPYGFGNYTRYTLVFTAAAGDTIRVWMYSPASPGYLVIDDASLTVGRGVNSITSGSWTVNPDVFVPPFAYFSFRGDQFSVSGRFQAGEVAAKTACDGPVGCAPGQMIALDALFSNKTPDPFARFAYGSGTVGTTTYADVEFGGIVRMSGGSVTLPTPGGPDELVSVSAPFSFSGTLTGVRGFFEPTVVFSIAPVGHGNATLLLRSEPNGSGGFRLVFRDLTFAFM